MRKIKEVLRLHFEHQQSARQIAKSCAIARSTVKEYLHRAEQAKVLWPLPPEMDDVTLENQLFPPAPLIRMGKVIDCDRHGNDRTGNPHHGRTQIHRNRINDLTDNLRLIYL